MRVTVVAVVMVGGFVRTTVVVEVVDVVLVRVIRIYSIVSGGQRRCVCVCVGFIFMMVVTTYFVFSVLSCIAVVVNSVSSIVPLTRFFNMTSEVKLSAMQKV